MRTEFSIKAAQAYFTDFLQQSLYDRATRHQAIKFMPYISETVILRNEPAKAWVFQQLDFFLLPITDRYYTIRIVIEPDRFGAGSIELVGVWKTKNLLSEKDGEYQYM